jgi:hypothetical protein
MAVGTSYPTSSSTFKRASERPKLLKFTLDSFSDITDGRILKGENYTFK